MKQVMLFLLVLLLVACNGVSTQPRPESYYREQPQWQETQEQASLFKTDQAVITDEDIARILGYKFQFPSQSRIAILPLGQQAWWSGWSDEFAQLNQKVAENFIATLRSSNAIYDASYLPSLLVPERRTVPYLREAAARYQADLLFMYRTNCQRYEKSRLFSADETKAYCTVEAVVLDTRSGIIPFTSVATETFSAKEGEEDLNFSETIRKAEIQAIGNALSQIAKDFVGFIEANK